ncbi:MAG: DUF1684 domain-containing protein [Acidimicrobiia bacterium]|nr:DUF1684 domain-containing protein [Acidimicrobiia bacterium]
MDSETAHPPTDDPRDSLDLLDYRRRVQENYRSAREGGPGKEPWLAWRRARDELFASHPQTALEPADRQTFAGLPYFSYDLAWRFEVVVESVEAQSVAIARSGQGHTGFRRFGRIRLTIGGTEVSLTLYRLDAYGDGVFLRFRDATSGQETYWGGRYLLDTAKGADLGHTNNSMVVDFKYAYHPSCVHSSRWSCPLAPQENRLTVPIEAGERLARSGLPWTP